MSDFEGGSQENFEQKLARAKAELSAEIKVWRNSADDEERRFEDIVAARVENGYGKRKGWASYGVEDIRADLRQELEGSRQHADHLAANFDRIADGRARHPFVPASKVRWWGTKR